MPLAIIKGFEVHGRATRKAAFLARMEMLVPWAAFCSADRTSLPEGRKWTPAGGFEENALNVLKRPLAGLNYPDSSYRGAFSRRSAFRHERISISIHHS